MNSKRPSQGPLDHSASGGHVIRILIKSSVILAALWSVTSCSPSSESMDSMVIAYAPFESIALLTIAEDQRLLGHNGLNVTLRKYDTGVGALDGMLNGEADIAVGTNEFPLVARAFQKERIRSIGSIAKSEFIYLVGRRDRGIERVSDLKGKRVGTTSRTIAEFFLGRFLEIHALSITDITLVDLKTPAEWVDAVANGEIDAIATAQPYANSVKDRLGANAILWSAQSSRPLFTQVISTDDWISKHPELVSKFLKSLAQAEEYAIRNPAEAKATIRKRLNLDPGYLETVWSQNQYFLSLDQSLIVAMEDEARWMLKNGLTTESEIPDFTKFIHEDGLKAIMPERVTIIR
jgi:NitT/TauT family transport system substrate-binding protein